MLTLPYMKYRMNKGKIRRSKATSLSIAVAALLLKLVFFMAHLLSVQTHSVSMSPGTIDTFH